MKETNLKKQTRMKPLRGRKSGPAAMQAEQSLLALRIAIYDPQPDAAEPRIEYAASWETGGSGSQARAG